MDSICTYGNVRCGVQNLINRLYHATLERWARSLILSQVWEEVSKRVEFIRKPAQHANHDTYYVGHDAIWVLLRYKTVVKC
jgi:hypothetical protein